jgi:hypothetical protein
VLLFVSQCDRRSVEIVRSSCHVLDANLKRLYTSIRGQATGRQKKHNEYVQHLMSVGAQSANILYSNDVLYFLRLFNSCHLRAANITRNPSIQPFTHPPIHPHTQPPSIHLSMALQPFVWPCTLFSQYDSLNGGSACRKAATYTQNNMNTQYMQTGTLASSGIQRYDPSFRAGQDGSCLSSRENCDRH